MFLFQSHVSESFNFHKMSYFFNYCFTIHEIYKINFTTVFKLNVYMPSENKQADRKAHNLI